MYGQWTDYIYVEREGRIEKAGDGFIPGGGGRPPSHSTASTPLGAYGAMTRRLGRRSVAELFAVFNMLWLLRPRSVPAVTKSSCEALWRWSSPRTQSSLLCRFR